MKFAVDKAMSKFVDEYSIHRMGVPESVLMERAALAVAGKVAEAAVAFDRDVRIGAVCGCGNNGADGIAAARILTWQGLPVEIIIAGDESHATDMFRMQKEIALKSGLSFGNLSEIPEYDILVDALFGVGLSRGIEGRYGQIINAMNEGNNYIVSVDIPSGVDCTTGQIMNTAIRADSTVTFGYHKAGMLLYPGREYAGDVTVADIGFCPKALGEINPVRYFVTEDIKRIPSRKEYSNKGTYLRTLVIAGSRDMSGAAYLSGAAAYRCGAGLVEIFSYKSNTDILKKLLPEAIVTGYDEENAIRLLGDKLNKADIVILGPGLSTDTTAEAIVKFTLEKFSGPLIIDADGLNIISRNTQVLKSCNAAVIITPHIGEMSRLTGSTKEEILSNPVKVAKAFAKEYGVVCVLKDAATVVAEPESERIYINTSGCAAMSKAGCGDVLTGVIGAMLALKLEPFSAASMGVYVHGIAGECATDDVSSHSLMASDMLKEFGRILPD